MTSTPLINDTAESPKQRQAHALEMIEVFGYKARETTDEHGNAVLNSDDVIENFVLNCLPWEKSDITLPEDYLEKQDISKYERTAAYTLRYLADCVPDSILRQPGKRSDGLTAEEQSKKPYFSYIFGPKLLAKAAAAYDVKTRPNIEKATAIAAKAGFTGEDALPRYAATQFDWSSPNGIRGNEKFTDDQCFVLQTLYDICKSRRRPKTPEYDMLANIVTKTPDLSHFIPQAEVTALLGTRTEPNPTDVAGPAEITPAPEQIKIG